MHQKFSGSQVEFRGANLLKGDAELLLAILIQRNLFRLRRLGISGSFSTLRAPLRKSGYRLILMRLIRGRKLPESLFENLLLDLHIFVNGSVVVVAVAVGVVSLLHARYLTLESEQEVV